MEKIQLHNTEIYNGALEVKLELMIHSKSIEITNKRRPAMVIFPGGGYEMTSDREAESIAAFYFSAGYNTFTVRYSVGDKAKVNKPLYDAAAAIAHVRTNAEQYCIDPEKIAVIGFSAGGHLAGYISTAWHRKEIADILGIDNQLCKPNAAVLCYPVVTNNVPTHKGSFDHLLGADRSKELEDSANLDMLVDERTCPCFIWHTATDTCVPVANSLAMARALTDKNIGCELHIFPDGPHGLGRATAEVAPDYNVDGYHLPYVARWAEWSLTWLEKVFYNGKMTLRYL